MMVLCVRADVIEKMYSPCLMNLLGNIYIANYAHLSLLKVTK